MIPEAPSPLGILWGSAQSHGSTRIPLFPWRFSPSQGCLLLPSRWHDQGRTAGRGGIPECGSSGSAPELLASPNYSVISSLLRLHRQRLLPLLLPAVKSPHPGGRRRFLRAGFPGISHCHSLPGRNPWHLPQPGLLSTNRGINAGTWEFHRRYPLGTSPANLHLDGCLSLSTLLIKARSPPVRQRSY